MNTQNNNNYYANNNNYNNNGYRNGGGRGRGGRGRGRGGRGRGRGGNVRVVGFGVTGKVQEKQKIVGEISDRMKDRTVTKLQSNITKEKIARGRKKLIKLLSNKRNSQIKLVIVGNNKAFCVQFETGNQYIYTGLTKKLKKVFYPELEEDPVKKRIFITGSDEIDRAKVKGPYYKPANMPRSCPTYGKDHGTQVHREIEIFTECMVSGKGAEEFFDTVKDPDPCTLRIICLLDKKGWVPILSEFQIWDEDLKVATSIDLIVMCLNTGKIILLELKNGYEGESYDPLPTDPKFPEPLEEITNCPVARHMLQLISMDLILRKKYDTVVDDLYIIRTMSKQRNTQKIEPPGWCKVKKHRDNIYKMLSEAD